MVLSITLWCYWPLFIYNICFLVNSQIRLLTKNSTERRALKTFLSIIVLMSLTILPLAGQTRVDYQLRALTHIQLPISTNGQGIAGWLIAPDLTKTDPARLLAVGGWLVEQENSWQEYMADGLFGTDGSIQPALNFRSYAMYPKAKRLDFYSGLMLRPDRGIADSYITLPISKFRLGLETELTAGLETGIKSSARLGPRLSFKIPKTNLTFATSALFDVKGGKGDIIVRTYLLYTFSGKH